MVVPAALKVVRLKPSRKVSLSVSVFISENDLISLKLFNVTFSSES